MRGRSGLLRWKFKGKPGEGEIEILSGTEELAGMRGMTGYEVKPGSDTDFTWAGEAWG